MKHAVDPARSQSVTWFLCFSPHESMPPAWPSIKQRSFCQLHREAKQRKGIVHPSTRLREALLACSERYAPEREKGRKVKASNERLFKDSNIKHGSAGRGYWISQALKHLSPPSQPPSHTNTTKEPFTCQENGGEQTPSVDKERRREGKMRKLAQRKWADSFDLVLDFRKKRIKN